MAGYGSLGREGAAVVRQMQEPLSCPLWWGCTRSHCG
jgi:hypothetical protein